VGKVHLYRFQKRTGQQKTHNFRGQEEERTSNTVQRLRISEGESTKENIKIHRNMRDQKPTFFEV
jgi:hypothetical protein